MPDEGSSVRAKRQSFFIWFYSVLFTAELGGLCELVLRFINR